MRQGIFPVLAGRDDTEFLDTPTAWRWEQRKGSAYACFEDANYRDVVFGRYQGLETCCERMHTVASYDKPVKFCTEAAFAQIREDDLCALPGIVFIVDAVGPRWGRVCPNYGSLGVLARAWGLLVMQVSSSCRRGNADCGKRSTYL